MIRFLLLAVAVFGSEQVLKKILMASSASEATINPGVALGAFAAADPVFRTATVSILFILTLFVVLFIQYYFLSDKKFAPVSHGLAVLLAGISGNALDRIRFGYAIDYIRLSESLLFNLSDMLILVGSLVTFLTIFKMRHSIWPDNDSRRLAIVRPEFQVSFALKFAFTGLFAATLVGTFAFVFFKAYVPAFDSPVQAVFIKALCMIVVPLFISVFLVGLLLSSRIAGPVYAFQRFVKVLSTDKSASLSLRAGDSLKELEATAEDVRKLVR